MEVSQTAVKGITLRKGELRAPAHYVVPAELRNEPAARTRLLGERLAEYLATRVEDD